MQPVITGGIELTDDVGFNVVLSYMQILIVATTVVLMIAFSLMILSSPHVLCHF